MLLRRVVTKEEFDIKKCSTSQESHHTRDWALRWAKEFFGHYFPFCLPDTRCSAKIYTCTFWRHSVGTAWRGAWGQKCHVIFPRLSQHYHSNLHQNHFGCLWKMQIPWPHPQNVWLGKSGEECNDLCYQKSPVHSEVGGPCPLLKKCCQYD